MLRHAALAQDFYSLELDNGFGKAVEFISMVPFRNESVVAHMSTDIFSRMIYKNICPGMQMRHLQQVLADTLLTLWKPSMKF